MTRERHQRLRAVFEEALAMDVAGRARHVREALSDDADLGARCLQLLLAHDSAESFLERPIGRTPLELADDPFHGTDRFEVVGRVGAGGMGVVYAVTDRLRGEVVALKALRGTDAVDRYRLKREFRGLADVGHRNLVSLYELVVESEDWFLTMEFIDGVTFVDHVRPQEGAHVDLGRLTPALAQLVDGVDALHARGILHRDIKPSNILVAGDGRVVILDFGLIAERSPQASASLHETVGGTPAYVAPEIVDGATSTEASDWYGVGVTLYEALTGHVPFDGSVAEVLRRKRTEDPPPLRLVTPHGAPDDLAGVCMHLLSRSLEERMAGAAALRRLVAPAAGADRVGAPSRHAFVGRERELRVLDQAWEELGRGSSVTVSVLGQSGIGKSALVREFLGRCSGRGVPVILTGRCYENESVPHKALDGVVDDLSRYLAALPRAQAGDLLPPDVSALTRVFPVMLQVGAIAERARAEGPVTADPLVIRRRGFEGLGALLGRIAARQALVLWIDDLQWSDADSARVLEGLLSSPARPAMLTVLSFRSEESAIKPFLQALLNRAGQDGWSSLALQPLAEDEASTLLDDVVPASTALSADERNHLLHEAAGSPFVLEQLALHAGAPGAGATAPPTLAGMLASRLTALPPQARAFVETLAICGRPVAPDVVCDACGIDRDRQSLVVSLRNAHLIRSSGSVDRVEPYHDRVREALAASLAEAEARGIHARMAGALTARHSDDYEALYGHYRGAGDTDNASMHAARAAQKASAALAFDRAATLYAQALELTPQSSAVRSWQEGLASALANAGRPAEAAEAYLRVADMSGPAARIESQRRAAEQFLIGGHIDRGLGLVRGALENVGLSSVGTPRAALVRLVWQRARQWWRGFDFVERPERETDPETLARLDTCWSAASGLALVDVISASDFIAWYLRMALDAGDRVRIARGLAIESAARSVDWIYRGSAVRLGGQATALSQQVGTPQATATALLGEAMCAIATGQWRRALVTSDEALTILQDRCVGVRWELNMAQNVFIWALMYLGELAEVSRRLPPLLADARRRGDLYLATELCTRCNLVWLVADEPDEGEREALLAIGQWSRRAFHRQHYSAMLARVQTALYRGEPQAAWRLMQQHEAPLRSSMLMRTQAIRVESNYLRGRSALATAAGTSDDRLLAVARTCARRLARERMHWSTPLGQLLSAGIASTEADAAQARRLLATAIEGFDRAEMQWYAAVARRRLGELLADDEGQRLCDTAATWMAAQGIRNPGAITRMLAPGFREAEVGG